MAKYKVTLKNDVGDSNIIYINTEDGYLKAIEWALDSHYDEEDKIYEITCQRVEEEYGEIKL